MSAAGADAAGFGTTGMNNPLAADLQHVLARTGDQLWTELAGQRIFITGGTGFFGCWLLESLLWANARLDLGVKVTVLSRDPAAFARKAPHLAQHEAVRLYPGDVRTFTPPPGNYYLIIHAATEASVALAEAQPLTMLDTIVQGTRHTLDFARGCGARKLLLTSSGAVYGALDSSVGPVREDYRGAPDLTKPSSTYGEGKRLSELLCALYAGGDLECKIARCFAFIGPYLPLNIHYAAGNFLADALEHRPILIHGDGTPYRSYLYAADLAVWLWTIALRGTAGRPYNVGSENAVSILDLARAVAAAAEPALPVQVARKPTPGQQAPRYVPSTALARGELGLEEWVGLNEAIRRSLDYLRSRRGEVT
ncbi:MAG: NAD-dependent epimerase/dehydratase family protein [Phycisphaerae bacterium]|jgi:dTDP-glucose 4,6-dehydratase